MTTIYDTLIWFDLKLSRAIHQSIQLWHSDASDIEISTQLHRSEQMNNQ